MVRTPMTNKNSYLEKQYNTYFVVLRVPSDVRQYFQGRTRLSTTLKTNNLTEANRLKWPYVEGWKSQIELARRTKSGNAPQDIAEKAARYASWLQNHEAGPQQAKSELFDILDETVWRDHERRDKTGNILNREDTSDEEKNDTYLAYSMATKEWSGSFADEFISQYDVEPKTKDEAKRALEIFYERFPYTEDVTRYDVEDWVEKMLETRTRPTVKKRIGFSRAYWEWCSQALLQN